MTARKRARVGAATRQTAAAALSDTLRDRILDGAYARGTPLREEHLAEEFGLSRHTVRTALTALAAERLIRTIPFKGAEVTKLADDEVRAMQDLRCALESEAVRLVNARYPDGWHQDVLAPILDRIRRLRAVGADGDHQPEGGPTASRWRLVESAHAAVHQSIVDAAQSPRISEAAAALESEVRLLLANAHAHYDTAGLADEHEQYLQLLQQDGPIAVRGHLDALTAHLLAPVER